eukprot:281832-Lingulodinium_polyedra.AAC.1
MGPCEEPTVVAACDLPGSMVQQLLEALRCAGAACHLVLLAKDCSVDAWYGRPHTAAIAAARIWGARVAGHADRVEYTKHRWAVPG